MKPIMDNMIYEELSRRDSFVQPALKSQSRPMGRRAELYALE